MKKILGIIFFILLLPLLMLIAWAGNENNED